jgi:hypothetical protein
VSARCERSAWRVNGNEIVWLASLISFVTVSSAPDEAIAIASGTAAPSKKESGIATFILTLRNRPDSNATAASTGTVTVAFFSSKHKRPRPVFIL